MRDRAELPAQQKNIQVKVFTLKENQNDYTFLGEGTLQIVTDTYMFLSQHYIEVANQENKEIFLRSRLLLNNNYQRQKNTVILWNDPEQIFSNNLAISFEKAELCDMYWRVICSKIGKNYLQINGREKLDMPNQKNIHLLNEKIKSSYNLVAYHVLNSEVFNSSLWQTLKTLNNKNQSINGIDILRNLLSHFDPKIMEIFLSNPNFDKFLEIYESQCQINFNAYYKQSAETHQLVELSEKGRNKIELARRAKFVKDCVIDYAKDSMIENMLTKVIKENQIEALISILQENVIPKITDVYISAKNDMVKEEHDTVLRIITFFLECVWILRIHHADNTKMIFLNSFYRSGMLNIIAEMLGLNYYKALEILSCIAVLDSTLFINEFMNNYRNNPDSNLIRIICKKYSESPYNQFADETINFLRSLCPSVIIDKKLFEFLNKTLVLSIFNSCKNTERILSLLLICLSEFNAITATFSHIRKYNLLKPIVQKLIKNQLSKKQIMDVIKLLKIVLKTNKCQSYQLNETEIRKINQCVVGSGLFELVLKFYKQSVYANNLITSSIMGLIIMISTMKQYNRFVEIVQEYDFGDYNTKNHIKVISKYLELIRKIEKLSEKESENVLEQDLGRKRQHRTLLEQEQEQQYLQQEERQEQMKSQEKTKDMNDIQREDMEVSTIKNLMQLKEQIGNKGRHQHIDNSMAIDQLKDRTAKLKAQKKVEDSIKFNVEGIDDF